MTANPQPNDRYTEALDFIIGFLREHEQKLDRLNDQLATIVEQIGSFDGLDQHLDSLNQQLDSLAVKIQDLSARTHNHAGNP